MPKPSLFKILAVDSDSNSTTSEDSDSESKTDENNNKNALHSATGITSASDTQSQQRNDYNGLNILDQHKISVKNEIKTKPIQNQRFYRENVPNNNPYQCVPSAFSLAFPPLPINRNRKISFSSSIGSGHLYKKPRKLKNLAAKNEKCSASTFSDLAQNAENQR